MRMNDRIKHAWNAFTSKDQLLTFDHGPSNSRPAHKMYTYVNTSSYVSSIYNRIAMDVSMTGFKHVKINPKNEDVTDLKTGLNNCLTVEANIDQTHIQFIHDLTYSMFDEGAVAVVPVETTLNPELSGSYDINSLRVGRIVNWFPKHVEVSLYNDETGQNENIIVEKANTAIIENPLYAVVNDDNSTLKRLLRKLSQLDTEDDSGRLDVFITVPYAVKTETQRKSAEKRIHDIEDQLANGKNGIAYIDGTEKVIQMNRPVNSQLPETINKLTQQFYNQLGLTENIFNGTASEGELKVYYSRTIDPIVEYIVAEFNRKFITKTGRTQGQCIVAHRDLFKTITVEALASLADAVRRNYIATGNEVRKWAGLKPSNDPRADELFNPNIGDNKQDVKGALPKLPKPKKPELSELVKTEKKEDELLKE